MSRIITVIIIACVASGVVAASIGERIWGLALVIAGTCLFGIRRKFDLLAGIEEGGVPDPVSSHSASDSSEGPHADHTSDMGGADGSEGD